MENDYGFETSLAKMRTLVASWPRRGAGERTVSREWLESQLRVHHGISSVRVPGGRQSAQAIAESEYILEGLQQGELRERCHGGQTTWGIIKLNVKSGVA